jgi:hypothetical protein
MNTVERNETATKSNMKLLKYIIGTIVIGFLVCGVLYGLLYLILNLPSIQADIVIGQVKGNVAPLYDHLSAITSPVIQVKNKTGIQSGIYTFSLSDGADQYAHVWARVDLASNAPIEDLIAPNRAFLIESGFSEIPVNSNPISTSSLFRSKNDQNLVAGICLVNSPEASPTSYYTAFIDYDNGPKCENNYPNTLQCITSRYCAS